MRRLLKPKSSSISFQLQLILKSIDFECLGYYHHEQLKKYSAFSNKYQISGNGVVLTVTVGPQSIKKIKEKIIKDYDLSSIQMFIDSSTIVEPVERFLSLYTLMLHKNSDSQKKVDEEILRTDPTVAQYKSPHFDTYETVFSKLRNEMSHKRDGINILETQNEIRFNVDRFENIVKKIILKKP